MIKSYQIITHILFCILLCNFQKISADIFPIQFSIPEIKIVRNIPSKDRDFAFIIPGKLDTYIYDKEDDYYKDYQRSYFAITKCKAGWDCLRHYEILANGSIPYFLDLEHCPKTIMTLLPKELILKAMHLEGVHEGYIDHEKFDIEQYYQILEELLNYTREHLTTKKMAEYVLKTVNYTGCGKILYLTKDIYPDYLRCLTLIGLKELLGADRVIDIPKIPHIYTNYSQDLGKLYGKGMSYSHILPDIEINRENIEERIKNKEFDLIIYGSIHRGTPYLQLVQHVYESEKVIYFCGEDFHHCQAKNLNCRYLFLREMYN